MSEPSPAVAPRRLGARGARTRQRLLGAAEQTFTELGYHDASVTKIAEAAGVAPGTFYLYFPGKLQLFEEVIDDLSRRVRREMAEAAAHARSRGEAERVGFRAFFRFTAAHPGLYRMMAQAAYVAPASLRRHYDRLAAGYVRELEAAMERDEIVQGDAEVMAWALMGVAQLEGLRWLLGNPGATELDEVTLDELIAFVHRALGIAEGADGDQPR